MGQNATQWPQKQCARFVAFLGNVDHPQFQCGPPLRMAQQFRWVISEAGTQGRTRTGTPVKAGDFESPASTIPPLGPHDIC